MQLDWFLVICIADGICGHRGMKSAISPTHFSFPSFPGAGHNCRTNGQLFHSWFFLLTICCWNYPSTKKYLDNIEMRERKSESLYDSWNNKMILIECLANYKLHIWYSGKDGRFRDTAFIMFYPIKNKNIWGGKVASQCYRRNLTFS